MSGATTNPTPDDLMLPPLPDPCATVYVFGVLRPQDRTPWYLTFTNQAQADNYPYRCTAVAAVLLYSRESQDRTTALHRPTKRPPQGRVAPLPVRRCSSNVVSYHVLIAEGATFRLYHDSKALEVVLPDVNEDGQPFSKIASSEAIALRNWLNRLLPPSTHETPVGPEIATKFLALLHGLGIEHATMWLGRSTEDLHALGAACSRSMKAARSAEETKAPPCVWRDGCKNHRLCDEIGCCQQLGAQKAASSFAVRNGPMTLPCDHCGRGVDEHVGIGLPCPTPKASPERNTKCEHDLKVKGNTIVITDEGKRAVCVYCGEEWQNPYSVLNGSTDSGKP